MKAKTIHAIILALAASATPAAAAAWKRLPFLEAMPVNLAASGLGGAKVVSSERMDRVSSLLSEDAGDSTALPEGNSQVVFRLATHQTDGSLRFMNDGVAGSAVVEAGTSGTDWSEVSRTTIQAGRRVVEMAFHGVSARYLRLKFSLDHASTIRAFGLFGRSTGSDYSLSSTEDRGKGRADRSAEGSETTVVNLAGGLDEARPIYAFPAPANLGADDFAQNIYKFPPSRERHRTVVYDLGSEHQLQRFSTAYTRCPVRVTIYAFSNLPEKHDWRGKPTLDAAIFEMVDPVATGLDAEGSGHMRHIPGHPVSARYIAVRYEPFLSAPLQSSSFSPPWKAIAAAALGPVAAAFDTLPVFGNSRWIATTEPAIPDAAGTPPAPDGAFEATMEFADGEHRVTRSDSAERDRVQYLYGADTIPHTPPAFTPMIPPMSSGSIAPAASVQDYQPTQAQPVQLFQPMSLQAPGQIVPPTTP